MAKSVKLTMGLLLVAGMVYGGFYCGREIGLKSRLSRNSRGISSIVPFHASFTDGNFSSPDPNANVPPDQVFEDVLDKVQHEFVERGAASTRLSSGALTRMLASLDDPGTFYMEPSLRFAREEALRGHFYGIGATLTLAKTNKTEGPPDTGIEGARHCLMIVSVMPGSPAQRAGLHPRDVITSIDDHIVLPFVVTSDVDRAAVLKKGTGANHDLLPLPSKGLPLLKAMTLLMTGSGVNLRLAVDRSQETPAAFRTAASDPNSLEKSSLITVRTARTQVKPVEYRLLQGRVAFLRVQQFNGAATREFSRALDNMENIRGFILDLRGNPGGAKTTSTTDTDGFLSSRKLLSRLTKGGTVATLERRPNQREPLSISGGKTAVTFPRVVLVDSGTANLSEMVAAALRDSGAKIVGSHTFGDDTLELFTGFKNGSGVQMTTAHLLTTGGVDLNRGIEPDLPLSAGSVSDTAIQAAMARMGTGKPHF